MKSAEWHKIKDPEARCVQATNVDVPVDVLPAVFRGGHSHLLCSLHHGGVWIWHWQLWCNNFVWSYKVRSEISWNSMIMIKMVVTKRARHLYSVQASCRTWVDFCYRMGATFAGALLMRRFARRPLLIISSFCVSAGMIMLGYSSQINHEYRTRETDFNNNNTTTNETRWMDEEQSAGFVGNYLPLISVNFIAVSYQLGLGPVGWAYLGNKIWKFTVNYVP